MNIAKTGLPVIVFIALAACDQDGSSLRVVGQLESDRIEITAEVSEPIVERIVTEGQSVAAGHTLIIQDTSRIEARIAEADAGARQAQARLDELIRGPRRELIVAARAGVEGAEHDLDFRTKEYERAEQVHARQLASPELLDRAAAARDAAQANLDRARAQLDELLTGTTSEELRQAEESLGQMQAKLAALQIDLERHRATAPAEGVIDSLLFEPGERPNPGQPMAILLSGKQVHARVFVPESIRVNVASGTNATVYVDGTETPYAGRVRWVSSEAAFTPYFALTEHDRGQLTYAAKVDILDADTRLPDGVPVEVEFGDGRLQ